MNLLQVLENLAGLIGPTIQIVQAVEAAVPAGTKGSEKLAMVKTALVSAEQVAQVAVPIVEAVWPAISAVITSVVAAFNASGVFKRSTPPSA